MVLSATTEEPVSTNVMATRVNANLIILEIIAVRDAHFIQ